MIIWLKIFLKSITYFSDTLENAKMNQRISQLDSYQWITILESKLKRTILIKLNQIYLFLDNFWME